MRSITGSKIMRCISASIHVKNEIPTVEPMFSGSDYTTRLLRRPRDVWINCELTMSFVNRKLLSAIFDSLQLHTSNGFRSSLVWDDCQQQSSLVQSCSLTPKTAFKKSLLSSIQAEICIISYPLPVTGHHLRFLTNPHVGQSLRVARPRKHGYSRWNFLLS